MKTREIHLAKRPIGLPASDTYAFVQRDLPTLGDGELLLKSLYISVDPYMRNRMNDVKSYVPPFQLNQPLHGDVVAEVMESRHPEYSPGDIVTGVLNWAEYSISKGRGIRKVDRSVKSIPAAMNVLGLPGLTAYLGLMEIGKPQPGETVVVSGAAGAVGMMVGQIAKLQGCKVVGIAGSAEKCRILTEELGFDQAVNYKLDTFRRDLRLACDSGVDVYFDNVGGNVTDAVLALLNDYSRIPLCGQIALYNLEQPEVGPRNWVHLLIHRTTLRGFIVSDFADKMPAALNNLSAWHSEGKIHSKETIVEGFDNIPDAFLGLFRGDNIGKQLVKVADETRV